MNIAIIGIGLRMPEAGTLPEFQENLARGRDSVREISVRRRKSTGLSLKDDYQLLGYLEDIDLFDYSFFGISRSEAMNMSPQQRILMEIAYEAFENAGYNYEYFNNSRTAVYIGDTQLQYYELAREIVPTLYTGNMNSIMAGRLARFFNLRQKALMIDTTCSSSLVALHQACCDLAAGECDYALVGGVSLNLFPGKKTTIDHLGIQSPGGKARTFSAQADGTSAGEAGVCMLLKPLDKAITDDDIIHAVIKGTAVNQDANLSGSLTAPSSTAQAEVITEAWRKAGIDPLEISYIEAHGTGTKLGDPIEIEGIDLAFREFTDKKNFCAVSAVKSNIGHTDCVAGLAGLVKAVLSLKQRKLFPTLHFQEPNPFIDFENSSVYINDTLRPWELPEQRGTRIAGVSSFGLTGTNCHVVIGEAPSRGNENKTLSKAEAYPILLSGQTQASLKKNIKALHEYLKMQPALLPEDIGYTLAVGRKHHKYRCLVWAGSAKELEGSLLSLADATNTDKQQAVYTTKVLVFSDWTVANTDLAQAYCDHPVFRKYYRQCEELAGEDLNDVRMCQFAFQYSLYKLLEHAGVKIEMMVGGDLGKTVIAALTSAMPLHTAIQAALQFVPGREQVSEKRTAALLDRFKSGGVLFLEMGPLGEITRQIAALQGELHKTAALVPENERTVLGCLATLFLLHLPVDMAAIWPLKTGKRIELPAYQFDRKRCWLEEEYNFDKVKQWCHTFKWVEDALPEEEDKAAPRNLLLVAPASSPLAEALDEQLTAIYGSCYRIESETDCSPVIDSLKSNGVQLNGIIFLTDPAMPDSMLSACIEEKMSGLYAQFQVFNACSHLFSTKGCQLMVVTANACQVLPEEPFNPFQGMHIGLLRGIQAEYPALMIHSIDLDSFDKHNLPCITRELLNDRSSVSYCAYRNSKRYVACLSRQEVMLPENEEIEWFPEEGVYLVTGGATGIGLTISLSILRKQRSHFIILGRTMLPDKKYWKSILAGNGVTPAVYERIKALTELERLGARIEYHAVDISDRAALHAVISGIKKRYERINGVLHAAGLLIENIPFREQTLSSFHTTLAPKVEGTVYLDEEVQELEPQFFVLFSSLNALVPKKYSTAYAVANTFEDTYAAYRSTRSATRYLSVNWPGWDFNEEETPDMDPAGLAKELHPIKRNDGVAAFFYVLQLNSANIAVIPFDPSVFAVNPYFLVESALLSQPQVPAATPDNLTPMERRMLNIWREVLKSDTIGVEDDFFEAGGHSLIGIQIVNRIEKEFHVSIDIDTVFDFPTVKALCRELAGDKPTENGNGQVNEHGSKISVNGNDFFEITSNQVYWLTEQHDREYKQLHRDFGLLSMILELVGPLDPAVFQKAVRALIKRHESLRTTFHCIEGQHLMKIEPEENFPQVTEFLDVSQIPQEDTGSKDRFVYFQDHQFDFRRGPLFLVRLLKLEDNKHIVSIRKHHVIADGWSVEIISRDLFTIYKAYMKGGEPSLPLLESQFKEYPSLEINHERQYRQLHREYWSNLYPAPPDELMIPAEHKNRKYDAAAKLANTASFSFPDAVSKQLKILSGQLSTSLFVILQAGFLSYIHAKTGQKDMLFGTYIHNRNYPGAENQIGSYAKTMLIRTAFDDEDSFRERVRKVKKANKDMLDYNAFTLMEWMMELLPGQDIRQSIWKINLQYDDSTGYYDGNMSVYDEISQDFNVESIPGPEKWNRQIAIDMQLSFSNTLEKLNVFVEYDSSLYTKSAVCSMMNDFITYMQQLSLAQTPV